MEDRPPIGYRFVMGSWLIVCELLLIFAAAFYVAFPFLF